MGPLGTVRMAFTYGLLAAGMLAAALAASTAWGAADTGEGKEGDRVSQQRCSFGAESLLPVDERIFFSRAVNFAPADGQVCRLNPPRFRWQYNPGEPGGGGDYVFTFQVAPDDKFSEPVVDVETPFNFYNSIAAFQGHGPFYWRIGYRERGAEGPPGKWSKVRSFTLAADGAVWDRSAMAEPDFAGRPHPRMLFSEQSLPRLRGLVTTDPDSRVIFDNMRREADGILEAAWWDAVPESDGERAQAPYLTMARGLVVVAFVWRVTDDPKYAGVKERALRMARYPKGGRSSPEGAGGENAEDSTQITEFLGLLYDWLYEDLTEAERAVLVGSLDWRIDQFVNDFAWRRRREGRTVVGGGSISTIGASHSFEGFWDTFPAALAAYEESPAARECFHLGVNFFAGVGSSHGFDDGWNEGPGYGNSKFSWQVNSLSYLDSVFPEYRVGRNPWLLRIGEYFRAITPVGLKHAPWGHGSNRSSYYENGHRRVYRKLAFLTGDGRFLANWRQYGDVGGALDRPWIECALPLWREEPAPVVREDAVRVFPLSGWVTALSGPPSDPDTYNKGTGMIFCCRPRGGYSHSFNSDNSFHIFGYGQDLSHAAGTSDYSPHPFSSMSHNAILVDGLGQATARSLQEIPYYARLISFGASGDTAYWCGDATLAYPRERFRPTGWWGRLADVYEKRDLSHLTRVNRHVLYLRRKYFVILDDLAADKPARWTWLYHVLEADRMEIDEDTGSFEYSLGGVDVTVAHLLGQGALGVEDREGLEGHRNPLTGEDYAEDRGRAQDERDIVAAHNLWLTTSKEHPKWRFMAVIYPVPPGGPRPVIEKLDDLTVRVRAGDEVDVITFDPDTTHPANVVVNLSEIAPAGAH